MNNQTSYFLSILTKFGWLGPWLFFFIALVEAIPFAGSLFPGGTLIFLAGFFAAHGYFPVYSVLIFSTLGAIIGDASSYLLGRWSGDWVRRKNIIKSEQIAAGENFFKKYGPLSILWSRVFGTPTAIIPFVSGSTRIKPRVFFLWNILGSIGWSLSHVLLGYFSGSIVAIVIKKWSGRLGLILTIIATLLFLYWLINKHHQNIRAYYNRLSENFAKKLYAQIWFKKITGSYPVIREFFETPARQKKIFSEFLVAAALIILYLLVLILDVF